MRTDITKIINASFTRKKGDAKNALSLQLDHPLFKRQVVAGKTSFFKDFHTGVMYEEAKVKAGGLDDLQHAVNTRRVKTKGVGEFEDLKFYLPREEVGNEDTITYPEAERITHAEAERITYPEAERITHAKAERITYPEDERITYPEAERITYPEDERITYLDAERITYPEAERITDPEDEKDHLSRR